MSSDRSSDRTDAHATWHSIRSLRDEAATVFYTDSVRALRIARDALKLATSLRSARATGWGHRVMAEALMTGGHVAESHEHFQRARDAFRRVGDVGSQAQVMVGHVHALTLLGRTSHARRTARRARTLLEESADRHYIAKLHMNLGNLHFQREDPRSALAEYDAAARTFAELGIRDDAAIALDMNRGVMLTELERHREAEEVFRRVESECLARGLDITRAQAAMNRAYVHGLRAEFDDALGELSEAGDYFEKTDHPTYLAASLLNRAEIYNLLNLHEEARRVADDARALFAKHGLRFDEGLALAELAVALRALGQTADAAAALSAARARFRDERSVARSIAMDLLEADACRETDPAKAEALASGTLSRFRELGLLRWAALAAVVLGRISAADHRATIDDLSRRLPSGRYPALELLLLERLGQAHLEAGDHRAARRALTRAERLLERTRRRIPTERTKLGFLMGVTSVHARLVHLELARPRPSSARLLRWIEASKAQALADRMRLPQRSVSPATIGPRHQEVEDARRDVVWLQNRLIEIELNAPDSKRRIARLERRNAVAERRLTSALEARDERSRPGSSGSHDHDRSLEALPRTMPDGWGFLSFHLSAGASVVIATTADGHRRRDIAPSAPARVAELADRLDLLWDAAQLLEGGGDRERSRRSSDGTRDAARRLRRQVDRTLTELFELVWQPVASLGTPPRQGWIVSPHAAMHRIPLHALLGPDGYVVESTSLMLTPSATAWRHGRGRPRRDRTAWIAGVANEHLPFVRREVDAVERALEAWRVTRDLAPTREAFLTEAGRVGLVHLAAHGSLRSDNPAFSFVQMADGPLFVHDVLERPLNGCVVVLSACSTGRAVARVGDEGIGLARGLLTAGASAVVASLWPVDDRATVDVMRPFYRELAMGVPAPAALSSAMRHQIASDVAPWHWAPFTAFGAGAYVAPGDEGRSASVGGAPSGAES